MTPKEKAIDLMDKFTYSCHECDCVANAKQSALIAVDEIISIAYWEWMDSGGGEEKNYWQEVKQEIQKL